MSSRRSRKSGTHRPENEDLEKSRRSKNRRRRTEYLTDEQLHKLAKKSRDRLQLRELTAAVVCHGLSRNGLRRAKRRQDLFLFLKALMLYIQTMCALLVAIVAVLAYYRIQEAESAFYTTQLFLEIVLLFFCFFVVLFENSGTRYSLVLTFLAAFFLNIIQLAYYLLFDKTLLECQKTHKDSSTLTCLTQYPPTSRHNTYVVVFLALFHLICFAVALIHQFFYSGTLQHLIELAKAVGFTACLTHLEERWRREPKKRRRKRKKSVNTFGTTVDISKLPVGTVITAERSTSYKFKGNVQPGRMIIGSGEESMADSVTVQAPNKEAAKRDSKLVRHVMIDAVRQKQNGNAVVPMVKEQKVVPETEKQWLSGATQSSSSGVHQKEVPPYTTKPVTLMPQTTDQIPRPLMQESGQDSIQFNGIRKMEPIKSPLSYISAKSESRLQKKAQ